MKKKVLILILASIFSVSSSWAMQIYIKYANRTLTIEVDKSDTIDNVKAKIKDRVDLPVERMRLIFGQSQLEDGQTLDNYNILPESTLFLEERDPWSYTNQEQFDNYLPGPMLIP